MWEWIENVFLIIVLLWLGIVVLLYTVLFLMSAKDRIEDFFDITLGFKHYILLFIVIVIIPSSIYLLKHRYNQVYDELIHILPDDQLTYDFILKYEGYNIVEHNSVGYDYYTEVFVDGTNMETADKNELELISTPYDYQVSFKIKAVENDNLPDTGFVDSSVAIKKLFYDQEFIWNIYVRENRGRYTGNVAQIGFNFSIFRKVESSEVWENFFNWEL